MIDGVKCLDVVNEYGFCNLIPIQGFLNVISEIKQKGWCQMTLTNQTGQSCRQQTFQSSSVVDSIQWLFQILWTKQAKQILVKSF